MGKRILPPDSHGPIEPVQLREALEERYLAYALSTIMHRALPDVRDGLKPVHRRLLYAMQQLRLSPQGEFRKCAKIVGDTMGNFHPHGNQAIYDALARLAQDFSVRYPLIDGQGNFGNIDGDNPAADRYTEARLTDIAALLLDGIDEDTVDFRETYNGEDREPVVLPGAFPNLLANGASGIAVGMATSIPPHNSAELCDAALHLIRHPGATPAKLVQFVPGPDLPTGGIIVDNRDTIAEAYSTGRGSFRVRARWHKEDTGRGTYIIVVTEVPWLVQKGRLVEKLAELLNERKLPLVADVRDDPTLDPATRTAQVRIELANPGQALKIGMYVNVAFATFGGAESTVAVVPASAVQNVKNQQVVFVALDEENVFAMRPVRLGPEANGRYPVLEGVSVGDRIVTEGSFLLRAEWLKVHPG